MVSRDVRRGGGGGGGVSGHGCVGVVGGGACLVLSPVGRILHKNCRGLLGT